MLKLKGMFLDVSSTVWHLAPDIRNQLSSSDPAMQALEATRATLSLLLVSPISKLNQDDLRRAHERSWEVVNNCLLDPFGAFYLEGIQLWPRRFTVDRGEAELFSQSYPHPSFLEGPPVPMAMRMVPQPPMGSRSPRTLLA